MRSKVELLPETILECNRCGKSFTLTTCDQPRVVLTMMMHVMVDPVADQGLQEDGHLILVIEKESDEL